MEKMLKKVIRPDERILWTGRPDVKMAGKTEGAISKFSIGCLLLFVIILLVGGLVFSFFGSNVKWNDVLLMAVVFTGLAGLIYYFKPRFTANAERNAELKHYVLTNRRAIVFLEDQLIDGQVRAEDCWITPAAKMTFLKTRKHKSADGKLVSVLFTELVVPRAGGGVRRVERGFDYLTETAAQAVVALLKQHFGLKRD